MSLGTYDREELSVVGVTYGDDVPVSPGSIVCHVDYRKSSYGIIVAIDEHHATVLWSREPPVDIDVAKFKALAAPLIRRHNYPELARQMIQVEPLPPGAMPFYAKDDKEDV